MSDPENDRLSMPRAYQPRTLESYVAEVARLKADVWRLTAERDAWVAAVDAHVRERVWKSDRGYWLIRDQCFNEGFAARAEAEAAYRKAAGLEAPGKGDEGVGGEAAGGVGELQGR